MRRSDDRDVPESATDRDLIRRVRDGDTAAFAELWNMHAAPARAFSVRLTQSFDADDLVSEAFTRIFALLQSGKGPDGPFRPYLYVTIRNTATSWARRNREIPSDEPEDIPDPRATDTQILANVDAEMTLRALNTLPERWQRILWHTEVEGLSAQAVAEKMSMSANSAAALSYRAREGLRQAWIQMHIDSSTAGSEHRWALEHVGKWARNSLSTRAERRMTTHLESCGNCSVIASEARATSATFTSTALPIAVGIAGTGGLGWTARSSISRSGDSTRDADRGPAASTIVRRVRKQPAVTVAVGILTALVAAGAIASTLDGAPVTPRKPIAEDRSAPQPTSSPRVETTTPTSPPPPTAPEERSPDGRNTAAPRTFPTPAQEPWDVRPPGADGITTPGTSNEPKRTDQSGASTPKAISFAITSVDTSETALYPIVSGTADPDTVVTLSARNQTLGTVRAGADGRWRSSELSGLPAGTSEITASNGRMSDSQEATLTRPAVSIAFRGDEITVMIFGIPEVQYVATWDDNEVGSAIADESGYVSVIASVSAAGTHSLVVHAKAESRTGPRTSLNTHQ